jgi:hypothetical protein
MTADEPRIVWFPWQDGLLASWSIVGMNHYLLSGKRCLFVAMTKNGRCITEEGSDDEYLWNRLWHKAYDIEKKERGDEQDKGS